MNDADSTSRPDRPEHVDAEPTEVLPASATADPVAAQADSADATAPTATAVTARRRPWYRRKAVSAAVGALAVLLIFGAGIAAGAAIGGHGRWEEAGPGGNAPVSHHGGHRDGHCGGDRCGDCYGDHGGDSQGSSNQSEEPSAEATEASNDGAVQ